MDQIVEVKYDSQFNQIENLTWYPWVGKDYEDGKRRILIVGESHYIDEDIEDEGKLREQEVKVDKYHTRNCLYEVLVDKSWCNRTYPNLMEALCDRGIISEDKLVLSKIAYYNFIQRQLDYTTAPKERPNLDDYEIAWERFLKIVDILHPTDCIFVGIESSQLFESTMAKYQIQYSEIDILEKINRVYPRKMSINMNPNYSVNIVFMKHSSCYFSPGKWYEFLTKQIPEAMEWINSK